jgi:hypothetical protein
MGKTDKIRKNEIKYINTPSTQGNGGDAESERVTERTR